MEDLYKELTRLLNRHSAENKSYTPDYILAVYLLDCLQAFENAVIRREDWYGRSKTENERFVDKESDVERWKCR
jgi:hypothetical protein